MLTQNHKFQLLTIKLENIEWKLKQIIKPLKLPITENNLIYLPTTEAETLVRVWFLLGERDIYGFGERETAVGENKERRKKNREKKMEFGAAKKRLGRMFWVGHVSC